MQRLFKVKASCMVMLTLLFGLLQTVQADETLKLGIMQDKPGAAQQYAPMLEFFASKGIDVKLQGYRNYVDAAVKFEDGKPVKARGVRQMMRASLGPDSMVPMR